MNYIIVATHPPWGGVPVRVVVSLLRTLVTTPCPCVVLSGVDGRLSLEVPVCREESLVAFPQLTVEVVVVVLVHAVLEVSVAVTVIAEVLVFRDCAVCSGGGRGREREGERERERERERECVRERENNGDKYSLVNGLMLACH